MFGAEKAGRERFNRFNTTRPRHWEIGVANTVQTSVVPATEVENSETRPRFGRFPVLHD
jgi:hypothetical protein